MSFTRSLIVVFLCIDVSYAVRPFITDDARVVGHRLAQWESWLRVDNPATQMWNLIAFGPTSRLEVTAGSVFGLDQEKENETNFSYALPLVQAKYLLRPYKHGKGPGFAWVVGSFLPGGRGLFVPPGYGAFTFVNISQCFGEKEDVLLHANIGANYLYMGSDNSWVKTWGFGTQLRVKGGMHLVGEVFSGDPYIAGTGTAWQAGFRHFFSDLLQIDGTLGKGIAGELVMPFWVSVGLRVVTTKFLKRN